MSQQGFETTLTCEDETKGKFGESVLFMWWAAFFGVVKKKCVCSKDGGDVVLTDAPRFHLGWQQSQTGEQRQRELDI